MLDESSEEAFSLSDKDQKILDEYYELWLDGLSVASITERLGVTSNHLKRLEPFLLANCRHRLAQETRNDLVRGFAHDRAKLTGHRLTELYKYVGASGDLSKALKVMGIPLATYTEVWCKQRPELREEIEMLIDKWDLDTVVALHRRALGEDRPYRVKVKTTGTALGKGGEAVPVESESVTEGSKYICPDFNSLRFELINRMPDKYSIDGQGNGGGARGRILTALDKIIADDASADQEAAFDQANEDRHK
jgi:hypothetical protein